jgi:omega-6 fatty acid desaturase (delta-12 desaturase)
MLSWKDWKDTVARYDEPVLRKSIWQLVSTLVAFVVLFGLMFWTLNISYWLTLAVAPVTAGFMIRLFIIFHDCGHGSFFKSQRANLCVGFVTGVLTFTPFQQWRHKHALHHATSGDLDRRGIGDIWTLTVKEYNELPLMTKIGYRLYRNPFVIFIIGPTLDFVVLQRFASFNAATDARTRISVRNTNLWLGGIILVLSLTIGFKAFVMVQLPIIAIASSVGVFLFYVQHQYENVYWERHEQWSYAEAALYGSSFFKMPRILQWFSGNIGFHHIHHLSPRIPNYQLEACHNDNPLFQEIEPMTIRSSLKSLRIRLYDEDRHKVVGYHPHEHDEEVEVQN